MDPFRKKLTIYIGVICGSAALFLLGGWWLSNSIQAHAQEIALHRSLVASRARSLEILARLKQNSRDVDTYVALMDRLLPQREDLLNFPRWIDLFARSSQVGLNFNYQPGGSNPADGNAGWIGFNLEATGSVEKLTQFVEELETKSRQFLVSIETFELTRQEDQYRLIMGGRVFYR